MIVVTGAAGFIGSGLVARLNSDGYNDIVLVDDFSRDDKRQNYEAKRYSEKVDRANFDTWLTKNHRQVEFIFHLGARTNTAEFDSAIFDKLNLGYSQMIWKACVEFGIPVVYASSAATYGMGEHGYNDDHATIPLLKPLNPYGDSKNDFDNWALLQEKKPHFWAGLKFFNVYGPNEFHKGRMASVIFHSCNQIKASGKMQLFRSHNPKFTDGGQMRDFVYVKDLCDVMMFLMLTRKDSGIYNMGTGKARTFLDLTKATFSAMGVAEDIGFIDTPVDIRDKYQYFTEANMSKLRSIGYSKPFTSLEEGVNDYVKNYLIPNKYW